MCLALATQAGLWMLSRLEDTTAPVKGKNKKSCQKAFLKLPEPNTTLYTLGYQVGDHLPIGVSGLNVGGTEPNSCLFSLSKQAAGLLQYMAAVQVELRKHQLDQQFNLIEMPLIPVLASMQHNGMRVSLAKIVDALALVQERLMLVEVSRCQYHDHSSNALLL